MQFDTGRNAGQGVSRVVDIAWSKHRAHAYSTNSARLSCSDDFRRFARPGEGMEGMGYQRLKCRRRWLRAPFRAERTCFVQQGCSIGLLGTSLGQCGSSERWRNLPGTHLSTTT